MDWAAFERVCEARGVPLADTWGYLLVQAEGLPQLSNAEHLAYLNLMLERHRIDVFILAPLDLTLLAGVGPDAAQASNLYQMGPLF
jgi:hypothetical protein